MDAMLLSLAILTASLEDDRFLVREAAAASLANQPASQLLIAARPMSFGVESRHRQSVIWVKFREYRAKHLKDKIFPTGSKILPWVDTIPDDFDDRWGMIRKFLEESEKTHPGPHAGLYEQYRLATREMVGYLLLCGWEPEQVVELLDGMAEREARIQKIMDDSKAAQNP